ncbi:MAG: hypothetical protein EOP49_07870 [Sphingobacteriales bacterium]|nr:MAG: hypothetical protein EOP49_07870 [Sphingobacteriales bacterium]
MILLLLLLSTGLSVAQPVLPDLSAVTQRGLNILSWHAPYDGIKSIAVQRSSDSVYNYTAIGYVKNVKKGNQAFIDGHPVPGNNWYRLYIVFNSDLTWYSNSIKLFVDSATLAARQAVLPPNDSLQKLLNTKKTERVVVTTTQKPGVDSTGQPKTNIVLSTIPDIEEINAYTYIRSQYVFTNPFTGHVNVELPDDFDRKILFSIDFFDQKNNRILQVPKVGEHSIIIDKRNFQRKGLYKFELKKNADILETGYITIY